jgi:hypothetical protein
MDISDEQIDAIFGDSPYCARRTMDKTRYEVIRQTNADWRDVIDEDPEHCGFFSTYDEAETVRRRRHVRFVFTSGSPMPNDTLTLTGITPGPAAPLPEPLASLLLLIDPGDGSGLRFWLNGYRGADDEFVWHRVGGDEPPLPDAWRVVRWFALPEPE